MSNKQDQPKKIYRDRPSSEPEKSQADKFRKAARELETDQSEEAFDKIVKRIAKSPPPKDEEKPAKK